MFRLLLFLILSHFIFSADIYQNPERPGSNKYNNKNLKFGARILATNDAGINYGFQDIQDHTEVLEVFQPSSGEAKQISSTNNSDTQQIKVFGLDGDGYEITEVVSLQGQTPVSLTLDYWRIFRAYNNNDSEFLGDIFIYKAGASVSAGKMNNTSDFRLHIGPEDQQTLTTHVTVPRGCILHIRGLLINTLKGDEVQISGKYRTYGGVWRTGIKSDMFEKSIVAPFEISLEYGELTDLKVVAREVSGAGTPTVNVAYIYELQRKDFLPRQYGLVPSLNLQ